MRTTILLLTLALASASAAEAKVLSPAAKLRLKDARSQMRRGGQTLVEIVPGEGAGLTLKSAGVSDPVPGSRGHNATPERWEASPTLERVRVEALAPISLRYMRHAVEDGRATPTSFVRGTRFAAKVKHADGSTSTLGEFRAQSLVTATQLELPLRPGLNELVIYPTDSHVAENPSRTVQIFRRYGMSKTARAADGEGSR